MTEDLGDGLHWVEANCELKPVISHLVEAVQRKDGKYEQIYNYYQYVFTDLPDATEVNARVYFGERTVSITGLVPDESPKSTKVLIEYFRSRMFDAVECLSPDSDTGYRTIWSKHGSH